MLLFFKYFAVIVVRSAFDFWPALSLWYEGIKTDKSLVSKRIAVIGAGPSGLVTMKELLDQGHEPVCFEKAESLGGVFRFSEQEGVVWASCRLTSSGLLTAFSDYAVSPDRAEHMRIAEYVDYLSEYCMAFDLGRHLRYGATVEAVTKRPDGGWNVRWSCGSKMTEEPFDSVAVCSGLHQHAHTPEFPGQAGYPGEILHSSQYRRPGQVSGKKVLVVGAGESGADITAEIVGHASETVLSLRRGVAVVSRRAFGKPRDYLTSRIINSSSHWLFQTRHPDDDRKRNIFRVLFLPLLIVDKCLQLLYRAGWEYLPLFYSSRIEEVRTNLATHKLTHKLLEESGGTLGEQFATKDDGFVRAIAAGKCRVVSAVSAFDGRCVKFADGSSFEPDMVLLCTGFETRMPFLNKAIESAPRYLNTFTTEGGESLGFIGFLRPAFGAIPPMAELQARWFALVQSGVKKLPPPDMMAESIDTWLRIRRHVFRASGDRLGHLVDYTTFCDELAMQVGCKPGMSDLQRESLSFRLRFFSGPFVAAQYRLVGPNAKPELARAVIEGLPIVHPVPQLINLYLRWRMCRLLHRALGSEYRPKLSIV